LIIHCQKPVSPLLTNDKLYLSALNESDNAGINEHLLTDLNDWTFDEIADYIDGT